MLCPPGDSRNISNHSSSPSIPHSETPNTLNNPSQFTNLRWGLHHTQSVRPLPSNPWWADPNKTICYPYQMLHYYSAAKPELCLDLEFIESIKASPDPTKTNECLYFASNHDCRQAYRYYLFYYAWLLAVRPTPTFIAFIRFHKYCVISKSYLVMGIR